MALSRDRSRRVAHQRLGASLWTSEGEAQELGDDDPGPTECPSPAGPLKLVKRQLRGPGKASDWVYVRRKATGAGALIEFEAEEDATHDSRNRSKRQKQKPRGTIEDDKDANLKEAEILRLTLQVQEMVSS